MYIRALISSNGGKMDNKEFVEELIKKAQKIGIKINEEEANKFYKYMNLLLEWNEKINLTAITAPNEVILKHFIDSITINKYIEDKNSIMDIGTGAGFPGIPLKIINEDKKFILVDSLNKRINFLNEVSGELDLENIECIHARAEELASNSNYREKCDIVTSRAVARLATLLEYMLPFVKVGGKCICMKGANIEEELEEAKRAIEVLGGEVEVVDKFYLPDSDMERNIVVIKKVKNTSNKYPRKAGIPSKQPIM